jgi:hypothetical protein
MMTPLSVVAPTAAVPPSAPEASTATAALTGDDPRRERQPSAAAPAQEGLGPAASVPQARAAGQHNALAAAPARAGQHDPLPGLYASLSHAPSVAPSIRPFTVNRPEVEGGFASRKPAPQVHEPCARGRAFRHLGHLCARFRSGGKPTVPSSYCSRAILTAEYKRSAKTQWTCGVV